MLGLKAPTRRVWHGVREVLPPELRAQIELELRSWRMRDRAPPLVLDAQSINYIDLGCGQQPTDGFVGIDYFGGLGSYAADLRFPLKVASNHVDGIFTEHTLEHLTYRHVAALLRECHRILKPGGCIRVVLPDVGEMARRYAAHDAAWFEQWAHHMLGTRNRALATPMEAISFVTQEYGHVSCWDHDTVAHYLAQAGFVDVARCTWRQGRDPRMLRDNAEPDRTLFSLYMEARK